MRALFLATRWLQLRPRAAPRRSAARASAGRCPIRSTSAADRTAAAHGRTAPRRIPRSGAACVSMRTSPPPASRLRRKAAEMELADGVDRECVDVGVRVVAHVGRAHVHVAHVAQEPAARACRELGEEIHFRHRGGAESDVARRIFDDVRTAERVLHLARRARPRRAAFRRHTEAAADRSGTCPDGWTMQGGRRRGTDRARSTKRRILARCSRSTPSALPTDNPTVCAEISQRCAIWSSNSCACGFARKFSGWTSSQDGEIAPAATSARCGSRRPMPARCARCPATGRVTTALLIFTPSASCLR